MNQNESLRIALLNTADHAGGAETVVRLLRDGLRTRGHRTELWVGRPPTDDLSHTRQMPSTTAQERVANRFSRKGFFGLGLEASDSFCESEALAGVDLVHLHNIHGHYFSITALPKLAQRLPLVWTFHDFFPITGGCAFPYACERWLTRCGSCPQQGRYPIASSFDRTRRMHSIKRRAFHGLPVNIVTPSDHLGLAVKRSGVFGGAEFHTIPYGIDTGVFHPHRAMARARLALPSDRPVLLLAAQGLDDPRKGIDHAITALKRLKGISPIILLVGGGDTGSIADHLAAYDVRRIGYVSDPVDLARCYAAADLFVFPSLAENFPCSVQEAMACGTPVLAFDIDGVNEQIDPDATGFVVPTGDTDALTRAVDQLLRNVPRLAEVGRAARRRAEESWTLDTFLDRHEQLYAKVLATVSTVRAS